MRRMEWNRGDWLEWDRKRAEQNGADWRQGNGSEVIGAARKGLDWSGSAGICLDRIGREPIR